MKKALFIVGPTAVGKTDLAFKIYQKIPSVLISADSIQVYRGADIISGKDKTFKTELLDIVASNQSFSVSDFIKLSSPIVKKAYKENKIPIVVGGTAFYIDALFGKIDTINIPPNKKLREVLENLTLEELKEKLKRENSKRFEGMNNSDINNKRRLIRALEVGSKISKSEAVFDEKDVLIIGIKARREHLRKRIETRVKERIDNGALEEARKLFKGYDNLASQLKDANGYFELFEYLLSKSTYEEAIKKWVNAEYKYAKNQMTWLKKRENITWFDIENNNFEEEIIKLIAHEFSL